MYEPKPREQVSRPRKVHVDAVVLAYSAEPDKKRGSPPTWFTMSGRAVLDVDCGWSTMLREFKPPAGR